MRSSKVKLNKKRRVLHKSKRQETPLASRKQNLSQRKKVEAQSQGGRIHGLEDVLDDDRAGSANDHRTPVEQALENWKARQQSTPWWWLGFAIAGKSAGVCIVQGWSFLDAVNEANRLRVSVPMAAIRGDELSDMWTPREGGREKWANRLLSGEESKRVFGAVEETTEVGLYSPRVAGVGEVAGKVDEVYFTGGKAGKAASKVRT
jgi:hypothetical protein